MPAWLARQPGAQHGDVRRKSAKSPIRRWTEEKNSRNSDGCRDMTQPAIVCHDGARRCQHIGCFLQRKHPYKRPHMGREAHGSAVKMAQVVFNADDDYVSKRSATSGKCGHRFAAIKPDLQPGAITRVLAVTPCTWSGDAGKKQKGGGDTGQPSRRAKSR
jgi:hypothetical protein